MNRGVVYAAFGEKYVREANESVASLRMHMPHLPVTLFTDEPLVAQGFDEVVEIEQIHRNRLDKIENICRVSYHHVLFLDSDTYVCSDFSDVFDLLGRFDIAMAHAPRRVHHLYPSLEGVPDSFPEFNSGVIALRNTPSVQAMFALWGRLYAEALASDWFAMLQAKRKRVTLQDQHFLRKAMYDTDLHIATLPYEYNCRMVPGIVSGEVKVLHGRHADMARTAVRINAHANKRLFTPSRRSLYTIGARQAVIAPYLATLARLVVGRDHVLRLFRRMRTGIGL